MSKVAIALGPPLFAIVFVQILFKLPKILYSLVWRNSAVYSSINIDIENVYQMNKMLLCLFWVILLIEVAYFRQVPLISMAMGADVTHFDFGIPGLHGFLYAIGASAATISYALYLLTRQRRHLFQVATVLLVFVLLVTRKMFLVVGLQMLIFYIGLVGWRRIGRISIYVLAIVFLFGFIGDI